MASNGIGGTDHQCRAAKAVNSVTDSSLQKKIQCLRNQLSEVLALETWVKVQNFQNPEL